MERYKLDILGISECRWTGSGKMTSQGHTVLYSGRNEHTAGVAIIISKKNKKSLLEWNPIDDRTDLTQNTPKLQLYNAMHQQTPRR